MEIEKPRNIKEIIEDFYSIERAIPAKVIYLFSEISELVSAQEKELDELRSFKKNVEHQHLRR